MACRRRRGWVFLGVILMAALLTGGMAWSHPSLHWRAKVLLLRIQRALFPPPVFLPTPVLSPPSPSPPPTPTLPTSPSPTPGIRPTPTPSPTPTPLPTPTPTLPLSVTLQGFVHQRQTFNNCGPATLTTALSYFGRPERQDDARAALRPGPVDDKNVSPEEMAAWVRSLGLEAWIGVGGDALRLKRLIAAGFPVIVEQAVEDFREEGWLGHYVVISGYDDTRNVWLTQDTLRGADRLVQYEELDRMWRHFNRLYLVIYRPEETERVAAILGEDMDRLAMYTRALSTAQAEATADPGDAFAFFNMGTNLVALGRYEEAAAAFDEARRLGLPRRILWYQFGPYEAYYRVGRYEDVIQLANTILKTTSGVEESLYWRGMAYEALGETEKARRDWERALKWNPNFAPAREALARLP